LLQTSGPDKFPNFSDSRTISELDINKILFIRDNSEHLIAQFSLILSGLHGS